MNLWIYLVFGMLCIPEFIIGKVMHGSLHLEKKNHSASNRTWNKSEPDKPEIYIGWKESGKVDTKRHHVDSIRNVNQQFTSKKTRHIRQSVKPSHKRSRAKNINKPEGARKKIHDYSIRDTNDDGKTYHTFEEIHEHVDDNDQQYQASERLETEDEPVKEEKQEKKMKIKIKHHHHHHHHNHIKEVIKTVPKPYPVEKIVHIPIEKIVEKIIHVPKLVNVTVEKVVHVPVEKIVEKIVHIPKPVHVPKPYIVEKIVEKVVHVPKPYPVLRTVPYPVEIKVPVQIEKKVPVPFRVEVERKVPVYIHSKEPYRFEQSNIKSYHQEQQDDYKFHADVHEPFHKDHELTVTSNKIHQYKQTAAPIEAQEYHNIHQPEEFKHIDLIKNSHSMEQSTAESEVVPVKSLGKNPFKIHVPDINSHSPPTTLNNGNNSMDLQPQASMHGFHGLPFSLPIQLVHIQPMPFQSPISFELPIAAAVER